MTDFAGHGPVLLEHGVRFRLWAPGQKTIKLVIDDQPRPMSAEAGGWHSLDVADAGPGSRYRFELEDGTRVPDPASRFQPEDVFGPSEVIDPRAHAWTDGGWQKRPWHEAVVYEVHIGTFTPEGTFKAAAEKLPYLKALGVTAIEIMPIADFPGRRNWGYDGVLLYAPDSSYGRPEDLKVLIDAAHREGIMVLLDVVYNHFGPDGNWLPVYAPVFFTERHKTPWGAAINYDGKDSRPVRDFMIENALYWLQEFHFDGLRLDAVHAIVDDSTKHLLAEIAERCRGLGHLILENEENDAARLARSGQEVRMFTAQWNDDVHHVLHVAATGEDKGYYADYLHNTQWLGRALAEGFAFQGEVMPFRGHARGQPSAHLPPVAFVAFIQNHDQVGNRAFGDRIGMIAPPEAVKAIASTYLLLPQIPMLFMGEEWNASQPFPFFCDFSGDLANAVREGRRKEFARFPEFRDEAMREKIPDPQADATFLSAKLDWNEAQSGEHKAWHDWYQRILSLRHERVVPLLPRIGGNAAWFQVLGQAAVVVTWDLEGGGKLCLSANLSAQTVAGFPPPHDQHLIWQEGSAGENGVFEPWAVRWSIETPVN